jgi:hypothetical protein
MGDEGLEPATNRLRVYCSTIELVTHVRNNNYNRFSGFSLFSFVLVLIFSNLVSQPTQGLSRSKLDLAFPRSFGLSGSYKG